MPELNEALAWGVVGTGDISRHVCSDLARVGDARRLAVSSRQLETAQSFAAEFGFERAYGNLDDMLADTDIDVVYIGTPHATHLPISLAAIEAGKHVLVEKPIGVNAAEVRTIAHAARAAGVFAMEAMWTKFAPAYQALLDEITAGSIGEVGSIRASFGLPFDASDSMRWSATRASSTLLDQGIYPVTLALNVLGVPDAIRAHARTRADGVDLSDRIAFEYSDGRFAHLAASMVEFIDPSASINGTNGWLTVPAPFWAPSSFTAHLGTIPEALFDPKTTTFAPDGYGYTPMIRAVSAAILAGHTEHPVHPLNASIETFEVLDRVRVAQHASTEPIPTLS